jgi:hypothetical protein
LLEAGITIVEVPTLISPTISMDSIECGIEELVSVKFTIDELLKIQRRQLTKPQLGLLLRQLSCESTMLYLRLAILVVSQWTSQQQVSALDLAAGVSPLINQIFDSLEVTYGRVLTRAAFGFLTFAVDGVSDNEMEDLLTLRDDVMNSVCDYNLSHRLPSHVWFRVREDMHGLIHQRDQGLLGWYHRQLQETAQTRYQEEEISLRSTMARYFGNLIPIDQRTMSRVSTQPNLLKTSEAIRRWGVWSAEATDINKRRCVEALPHMLTARMYEEAETELCSLESVVARAKLGKLSYYY